MYKPFEIHYFCNKILNQYPNMDSKKLLCFLFLWLTSATIAQKRQLPLSISVETQVPVQHLFRMSYNITPPSPFRFFAFFQGGLPAYSDLTVDYLMPDEDVVTSYLKTNLKPLPGFGAGLGVGYKHWICEASYQNMAYRLNQQSARQIVEGLLPEYAEDISENVEGFFEMFPIFGDLYNDYMLQTNARLQQLHLQCGYAFPIGKADKINIQLKAGAITAFAGKLTTETEKTNIATDFVVGIINQPLNEKMKEETLWRVIPTLSVAFVCNF
jgi:hypothetical protein